MKIEAKNPEDYISKIPLDRQEPMTQLRKVISENLPEGFREEMSYNMIGYIVPHDLYPDGYHCSPDLPLPFINIASQKNFIALYHMGIYSDENLMQWFVGEYEKVCTARLDMGKSCIRFKKINEIPYDLIGDLVSKMPLQKWVDIYESKIKKT